MLATQHGWRLPPQLLRLYPMKIGLQVFVLMLLSMPAIADPPYSGTVFVDPDILLPSDPSTFVQVVDAGSGSRQVFDRRTNVSGIIDALLFNAYYSDTGTVEIQVNPEFGAIEAASKAAFYGHAIGQLPLALRVDVRTVTIHKGDEAFGGGNNNILIHTDSPGYHGEWLEETIFHEACHTSLDSRIANTSSWISAQTTDPDFISTYARDNPNREDVAESCLLYYALRYSGERVAADTLTTISTTIANRILVLDSHNINPVLSADRASFFDSDNQKLTLTGVEVEGVYYEVILSLTDAESLLFTADSAVTVAQPNSNLASVFADGVVSVPLLLAVGERYSISLALHNENPVQFRLTSAVKLTD